jgi:hypothetical protein
LQALLSSQSGGEPGWHSPAWQVSPPLQASSSAQEVPSLTGVLLHIPVKESQESAVQGLSSSQSTGGLSSQAPVPGSQV